MKRMLWFAVGGCGLTCVKRDPGVGSVPDGGATDAPMAASGGNEIAPLVGP